MKNSKCHKVIEKLMDKMDHQSLSDSEISALYLNNPECTEEIYSILETWNLLAEIERPVPTSRMDDNFYESLDTFSKPSKIKESHASRIVSFINNHRQSIMGISIAASLFIAGMLVGPFFKQDQGTLPIDIQPIDNNEYYTNASYGYNQLSSNRLEDVNKIKELPELNQKIIDALNQALLKDPNINVRLSAIEAMIHFADDPQVRQNLIEAIPYQTSPIVQLTLAEVMIELQETRSKEAWHKLLKNEGMEEDVKKQLKETLEIII